MWKSKAFNIDIMKKIASIEFEKVLTSDIIYFIHIMISFKIRCKIF